MGAYNDINISGISEDKIKHLFSGKEPILATYRGSISHDTYQPQNGSDKDIMFVYVEPLDYYIGMNGGDSSVESSVGVYESIGYEIKKFMKMVTNANPNVMESVWCDDQHVIHETLEGGVIRENRDLFSSKKFYHSYIGFARSQMKLMQENPSKNNLGEKRQHIIDKHGYDTKSASHTIRILSMIVEFLTEGKLYVKRKDSQKYISIRNGHYDSDWIANEFERLISLAEMAYVQSSIPNEPDYQNINALCMGIIGGYHGITREKRSATIT